MNHRHLMLAIGIGLFGHTSLAAPVVSQEPLAKAATQKVAPNLLFILDDSGSMGWDYVPDYVDDSLCRKTSSTTSLTSCKIGHPPFTSSGFNKQYYDPTIRYTPGIDKDGNNYPDMTSALTSAWTKVATNGYSTTTATNSFSTSAKANIASGYSDIEWGDGDGTYKRNTSYTYPDNTYTSSDTSTYSTTPYYYNLKPIYCTDAGATNCSDTKTGSFIVEVPYRWCKSGTFTDCKAKKDTNYKYPSFLKPETATVAQLVLTLSSCQKNKTQSVNNVTINGINQLSGTASYTSGNSTSCTNIANAIVAKQSGSTQFTAAVTQTGNTSKITYTAKTAGSWANYTPNATSPTNVATSGAISVAGKDGTIYFERVNIVSTTPKYQINGGKPSGRTDCTTYTDGCSGTEEMTNFANWYAYYRTRMMAMKSAASTAFKSIDDRFRIGYTQINSLKNAYVSIRPFKNDPLAISPNSTTQKKDWYSKLLSANPSGYTPLREALSFAGRVYSGKKPEGISDDPVEYSCQQNFAFLTTDGYWNGPNNDTSGTGVVDINGSKILDWDGGTTKAPYFEGSTASNTSLADVAMYYYTTDLRNEDSNLGPITGSCISPSSPSTPPNIKVCENNVPVTAEDSNSKQHMVTYTLGLGVDGQLNYRSDYKTALSGDYHTIKNTPTLGWPKPVADTDTAVDDLWHAAVNGRGQYFSAQDPERLVSGLKTALANISSQYGAGAAAATSNLEPVQGENTYIYVATYTTGKWIGNLEARKINTTTGEPQKQCEWAVSDVPATETTTKCDAKLVPPAENDTTRKIFYNKDNNSSLDPFTFANIGTDSRFDVTKLSQYTAWSTDYQSVANSEKLINYLRGQSGYETRDGNTYQLFRQREAVLGDIIDSKPVYVCKPQFNYDDKGYASFRDGYIDADKNCTRTPVIYVGANDGMLHAFNATTGKEMWTFIPTPALSEMWRLADVTYSSNHRFYVDGAPHINNVCISSCDSDSAVWKTILVGTLGYGVLQGDSPETGTAYSGIYALDITDPNNPKFLYEIHSKSPGYTNKIGFTPGNVIIGKLDGQWVAVFASGYNTGDGNTYLFVVDAYTGASIRTIQVPGANGIARIRAPVKDPNKDASFEFVPGSPPYVYGGDLDGNVWRINLKHGTTAKIFSAPGKPFTTRPEITLCNNKPVLLMGSGKYFESTDIENKDTQAVYVFPDKYDDNGTLSASALESVSISGGGLSNRTIGSSSGDPDGWYVSLPGVVSAGIKGGSERINIDPLLQAGTLVFQSNMPEVGVCVASGHSWTNALQLASCTSTDTVPKVTSGASVYAGNELGVGITLIKVGGSYVPIVTGSGGSVKAIPGIPIGTSNTSPKGRYTGWRELLRN